MPNELQFIGRPVFLSVKLVSYLLLHDRTPCCCSSDHTDEMDTTICLFINYANYLFVYLIDHRENTENLKNS